MLWKEGRRDLADWIDEKEKAAEDFLGRNMDWDLSGNPFKRGRQLPERIVFFGILATAGRLITGTTDVLRIGQGVEQGGVKGYAKDTLRLLTIAGPLARGIRLVAIFGNRLRIAAMAETQLSSQLNVCSWVASTQAMRMTGRVFVTIDDLLLSSGYPNIKYLYDRAELINHLKTIGAGAGTFLRNIVGSMKALGATVNRLVDPTTMQAVELATLSRRNGVVLFNIKWRMKNANGAFVEVGHTLTAFRNALGQFRILDRSGNIVRNLAELERLIPNYGEISKAVPYDEMYFVADLVVREIIGLGISTIGIEGSAAITDHE